MVESDRVYGSIGAAVVAGVLLLIVLGWLPLYGWLAAGLAAGLIARGSGRGLLAGIISGAIVSAVATASTLFLTGAEMSSLVGLIGNDLVSSHVFNAIDILSSMSSMAIIKTLLVDGIVIPAIGGFIGGSILSRGKERSEEGDEEEE